MSRQTSFTLAAVLLLAAAPAAVQAQKAARPINPRTAMPADVSSGFGASNRNEDIMEVSIGTRHSSSLDNSDDALDSGAKAELWAVLLNAGDQVTVSVSSSAFDTQFGVIDPETRTLIIANDDIAENNTNSEGSFRAPRTGPFAILVTSYGAAERGAYTLQVTRAGGEQLALVPVSVKSMAKRSR